MDTTQQWRDKIAAVVPPSVDTKGVCDIVEGIEGQRPSEDTVRRWPLRYKLIGRVRRYEIDDVIAHVRQRYEQAPARVAAVSRRRPAAGAKAA